MEQTNEARAEDKPAYSMPRKEDEAARQQIQESKNEVKPPKEPDKPKKELTEEQRQKQKKLIVYPLMFIIFAIVMWLIFAPSEKEEEQGQSGFNTDVPAPADNALVGDKQAAYEQDLFNRKQDERRRSRRCGPPECPFPRKTSNVCEALSIRELKATPIMPVGIVVMRISTTNFL